MSSSAVNNYKIEYLENEIEEYKKSLKEAEEHVEFCRGKVEHLQGAMESTKEEINTENRDKDCDEIINPQTGLPLGEVVDIHNGDGELTLEYLQTISSVRKHMANGELEQALQCEEEMLDLYQKIEYDVEKRAFYLHYDKDGNVCANSGLTQVNNADFVPSKSIIVDGDEESITDTIDYAKSLRDEGKLLDNWSLVLELFAETQLGKKGKTPENVHAWTLLDTIKEIKSLDEYIEGLEEEVDDDDDDSYWNAIQSAIEKSYERKVEKNAKELELPYAECSNIARYNPKSHFRFQSESAIEQVDVLQDSLVNCKLRSRPKSWISKETTDTEQRVCIPFEYRCYDNSGFDVDGDLIAMCGDLFHDNLRESKTFVGFQKVPYPVNLESAKTLADLRDCNDSNDTFDENPIRNFLSRSEDEPERKRARLEVKGPKPKYFSYCIADGENERVYASCSRSGIVQAFSSKNPQSGVIAEFSFMDKEVMFGKQYVNCQFPLARCGSHILGSAGTNRLSIWNAEKAIEEASNTAVEAQLLDLDKGFLCGDIQWLQDSQIVVAPAGSGDGSTGLSSVRLYDVNAEKVTGLFCGQDGSRHNMGKQHCASTHNSLFVMERGCGVVYDIRSFQPSFVLHAKSSEEILGIPSTTSGSGVGGAPVAFTYGGENNECIECWDLRMPASHSYTMSTGNTIVRSLMWHKGTSSLLASTRSDHKITHGRYRSYMYEYDNDIDEEEIYSKDYWPSRAIHEKTYFGSSKWHCDCINSPVMLQYAFQNGRSMHEGHSIA